MRFENFNSFVTKLQKCLENSPELPGLEAQWQMAHAFRREWIGNVPNDARQSAVMILFYEKAGQPYFALIERTSRNPNDVHAGQMSFPGGQVDASDKSLEDTALRETWEEVGIPTDAIQILGKLTHLYIPVSNFLVHPFMGYLQGVPQFKKQPSEVVAVYDIPVSDLFEEARIKQIDLTVAQNMVLKDVRYFDVADKIVWGATAMILSELKVLLMEN